jgi:hypothetical protein
MIELQFYTFILQFVFFSRYTEEHVRVARKHKTNI